MKRNAEFALRRAGEEYYLFPYGQKVASLKRGIVLNETGAFLWQLLEEERTLEELKSLAFSHYEVGPEEEEMVAGDVEDFVENLKLRGLLAPSENYEIALENKKAGNFQIAGITFGFYGPQAAVPKEFLPFSGSENLPEDQQIYIMNEDCGEDVRGEVRVRTKEVIVVESEDSYVIIYPTMKRINEMHIQKKSAVARIYGNPPFGIEYSEELFHVLRMDFLLLAAKRQMFAIHSASFLYEGRAWAFSGSSGTGKSTHTNLWKEQFQTPILNGDLNLLALEDGVPVVKGIPWCGTSGISHTETYLLGGIVFLRQSKENYTKDLTEAEKMLYLSQRLISPSWTEDLLDGQLVFVEELAQKIMICQLYCTKDVQAAEVMKEQIDCYLKERL